MRARRGSNAVGEVFGDRYRASRVIGKGGMGRVYEAIDQETGARVAIKVLDPELIDEAEYVLRFRREAIAAAQLGHPNIVEVIELFDAPGMPPALAMELLEGVTLHEALRDGPFEPARAVRIARQILDALDAAHRASIIHRDLKPANVFLTDRDGEEVAKILDFGLARLMDSDAYGRLTATGVILGTPRYSSPEQLESTKSVDHRTDLYAVGVLLYCMLAGRPPFTAEAPRVVIDVMDHEAPPLRSIAPHVSEGLAAVVEVAMQKRASARFASAREFSEALERASLATAHTVPQVEAPEPAPDAFQDAPTQLATKKSPAAPRRLIALGVLLLVIGLGLGLIALSTR